MLNSEGITPVCNRIILRARPVASELAIESNPGDNSEFSLLAMRRVWCNSKNC